MTTSDFGHIHKPYYEEQNKPYVVYPGSLISLGFDELGKHGMIVGEIKEDTKKVEVEFITVDTKEFVEIELDISEIASEDNLIQELNNIKTEENKYYKVIFIGNRNFVINIPQIKKLIENKQIIKIKNNTKLLLDIEKIANENSLKGFFVSSLLKKIEDEPENKEKLLKVIEIGLEAMDI